MENFSKLPMRQLTNWYEADLVYFLSKLPMRQLTYHPGRQS